MEPKQHTFGGSWLDRHVFDFEAVPDGGGAPLGDPAAPDPEPPAWTGPSQDEWQATQERLAQFEAAQQPPPQPQQPNQPPPVPDPFSEDYAQQFQAYNDYQLQSYRQLEQEIRVGQAHDFAHQTFDKLAADPAIGEFDRDRAYERADYLHRHEGVDPVKALEQAARDTREYERRVGEAYHKAQLAQFEQNAGGRGQLPLGPAGAQTIPTGGLGNQPLAVTRKYFGTP